MALRMENTRVYRGYASWDENVKKQLRQSARGAQRMSQRMQNVLVEGMGEVV